MTKSDFEILLQKFDTIIQRKTTKLREAVPASIRFAVQLWYLACVDFFLNYKSTDSILITFSVICMCTSHKHVLGCRSSITVINLSFGHMLTAQIIQTNYWHSEERKGRCTLSVKLSDFTVWLHTWRKKWVNCAVLTGKSAGLRTFFPVVFHTENCAVHSGNPTISSVYMPKPDGIIRF